VNGNEGMEDGGERCSSWSFSAGGRNYDSIVRKSDGTKGVWCLMMPSTLPAEVYGNILTSTNNHVGWWVNLSS